MMAGPGVFHVEFGINETELTRCLEQRRYGEAERLIEDNSYSSYLNEGCYQRTPLFISLCGKDEEDREGFPRNLHMARLLTQCGANVNYRVPTTFFGCEYMGPGKSGLELVVSLFNRLSLAPCHNPVQRVDESEDVSELGVIGMDQQPASSRQQLLQQLLDLTFIMLTHGGDTDIRNTYQQSLLHRTAVFSRDPRMLYLLCENTDNLNTLDGKGNTPLGALCDPFPLGVDHFLDSSHTPVDPYAFHCHLGGGKSTFLQYLLSLEKVQLDHQNNAGRTALFHAMVGGDGESAGRLLEHGCDASLRGQVRDQYGDIRQISPLFASLCSSKVITSHENRYVTNKPPNLRWLAHLVSKGHFDNSTIINELQQLLSSDFPQFLHLLYLGPRLLHLLFGGATSSLCQAAARCVFHKVFLSHNSPSNSFLFGQLTASNRSLDYFQHPDYFYLYIEEWITAEVCEKLRSSLELNRNAAVYMQVELLRLRMAAKFRQFTWFKYHDEEFDGEDERDSSDVSSDENDSDLEYW